MHTPTAHTPMIRIPLPFTVPAAPIAGLCAALSAGCAASGGPTAAAFDGLQLARPGQPVQVTLRGGAVVRLAVPVEPLATPLDARRVAERLLATGTVTGCWQESAAGRRAWRWTAEMAEGGPWTLLVSDVGTVLERTHRIHAGDAPTAVATAAGPGRPVEAIEVVLGAGLAGRSETFEGYRITTSERTGQRFEVLCDGSGRVLEEARLLTAELAAIR